MDIYLIRHAESELSERHDLIRGRAYDCPLTTKGKIESIILNDKLKKISFVSVYSSPQPRAFGTAELVFMREIMDGKLIQSDKLIEYSAGDWEGKERKKIMTPKVKAQMKKEGIKFRPPNGESLYDVQQRVIPYLITEVMKEEGTVAVVTHGMVIKAILHYFLKLPDSLAFNIQIDTTSTTIIRLEDGQWKLIALNRI